MKTRIIRLYKGLIYLTPNDGFGLEKTTIPNGAATIKANADYFWEVERDLDENTGLLTLSVVNYHPSDTSKFERQKLPDGIKQLSFKNLRWAEFEPALGSYIRNLLVAFCPDVFVESRRSYAGQSTQKDSTEQVGISATEITTTSAPVAPNEVKQQSLLPETRKFFDTSEYKFEDAQFFKGRVDISSARFALKNLTAWFSIDNPYLFEEIAYIKSYLPKVFNKKTFTVTVEVTFIDDVFSSYVATSPDIAQIDDKMFKAIMLERIRKLPTLLSPNLDKVVFTDSELLTELPGLKEAGIISESPQAIIEILIEQSGARNVQQLMHLASTVQSMSSPMLFTLRPLFGFLFFVETKKRFSFCWELLNSHATYVWSFPKDFKASDAYQRIEAIIGNVHSSGRKQYRADYKNAIVDTDIAFRIVEHNTDGGFQVWLRRINAILSNEAEQSQSA